MEYNFTPQKNQIFTFNPTLDDDVYNVAVPWVAQAQRFYISISDSNGNQVVFIPLIGSSSERGINPINIVAGYFKTSAIYYYPSSNVILVTP